MNYIPKIVYNDRITGLEVEFLLDNPPEGDPFSESYDDNKTVTRSNNGTPQVQFNYTLKKYSLDFIFQTEATKDAFLLFRETAKYGTNFKYYPSSDESIYEEFFLEGKGASLSRPIPSGVDGEFEYDFNINMSRVL